MGWLGKGQLESRCARVGGWPPGHPEYVLSSVLSAPCPSFLVPVEAGNGVWPTLNLLIRK